MRILVTGSEGRIGSAMVTRLREAGHEVRGTDQRATRSREAWEYVPGDLRDLMLLRRLVQGVDVVIHAGAIPNDWHNHADEVLGVNVQGTWNVLLACVEAGVGRLVWFSSVNALGMVGGHRTFEYLPGDDAYPPHPMTPYQLSKHLGEAMCRSFSERHGLITLGLRPVFVSGPQHYKHYGHPPDGHTGQRNELFAYVDLNDVCEATLLALEVKGISHDNFLLTADDTTSCVVTPELVARFYPEIAQKQDIAAYCADNPYRSLIDCSHAKSRLGWQPRISWRTHTSPAPGPA